MVGWFDEVSAHVETKTKEGVVGNLAPLADVVFVVYIWILGHTRLLFGDCHGSLVTS